MTTEDDFPRTAAHYCGASLALTLSDDWDWELRGGAEGGGWRVGALTWERGGNGRWVARAREGTWDFSWDGRLRRRVAGVDAAGEAAMWFEGRRAGRGGEIIGRDERRWRLRPAPARRRWRLSDGDGNRIAELDPGTSRALLRIGVALDERAIGVTALTLLVLTACAVVRLDHDVWSVPVHVGGGEGGG
jgi:hypothetical protein